MPNHRTPHPTDGPGIGRKLKGAELAARLAELAEAANGHHRGALDDSRSMLDHAREAGEALIEAKRRLGHRGKWGKWVTARFDGSRETARVYMRIAREWNDPRLVEARELGLLTSINKVVKLLRGEPLQPPPKTPNDAERDAARGEVRRMFAEKVRELTDWELDVLGWPPVFDELWGGAYDRLKVAVRVVVGEVYPVDADAEERVRKQVAKRRKAAVAKR